ncbi:hypothetical protein RIF29_20872 [Crotalaria pallida]|uniref:Uncharacterized protein n=1 Tax=Crotalaria pallida TaxID=3830 RepID=A0AAN9ICV2_CROPI
MFFTPLYFSGFLCIFALFRKIKRLLETEILATDGSEERIKREDKQHPDGVSNKQQTCYLQPLRSKCKKDLHKFTIVDTSMVHGMDQSKVRQLRSLPFQTVSSSSESDQDTSQNSEDLVELACPAYPIEDQVALANSSNFTKYLADNINALFPHEVVILDSSPNTPIHKAFNATKEVENHAYHSDLYNDMRKQKSRACDHGEFGHRTGSTSMNRNFNLNEPISQPLASKSIPHVNNEGRATENQMAGKMSGGNSNARMLIDLNFPEVSRVRVIRSS